jgi:hypothetical protein
VNDVENQRLYPPLQRGVLCGGLLLSRKHNKIGNRSFNQDGGFKDMTDNFLLQVWDRR